MEHERSELGAASHPIIGSNERGDYLREAALSLQCLL